MKLSRRRLILLALALPLCAAIYAIQDKFIEDGNFRILQPGTVYRSGQLSVHEWKEVYRKHPFQSVINLRGPNDDKVWYQQEQAFVNWKHVEHYDLALSAHRAPDMTTMETLVEMLRAAPKPVLIHCMQGADRTGLASALYNYAILGQSAHESAKQLSLFYGHFPWLTSHTGAMDKAFQAYTQAHPQLAAAITPNRTN